MSDWWGREITGSDKAPPLAGHGVANDRINLLKVGFVFLRKVMLMEVEVVR